jgi:hypothetical protein
MAARRLLLVALAELLGMTLWLSATAAGPAIAGEFGITAAGNLAALGVVLGALTAGDRGGGELAMGVRAAGAGAAGRRRRDVSAAASVGRSRYFFGGALTADTEPQVSIVVP